MLSARSISFQFHTGIGQSIFPGSTCPFTTRFIVTVIQPPGIYLLNFIGIISQLTSHVPKLPLRFRCERTSMRSVDPVSGYKIFNGSITGLSTTERLWVLIRGYARVVGATSWLRSGQRMALLFATWRSLLQVCGGRSYRCGASSSLTINKPVMLPSPTVNP